MKLACDKTTSRDEEGTNQCARATSRDVATRRRKEVEAVGRRELAE